MLELGAAGEPRVSAYNFTQLTQELSCGPEGREEEHEAVFDFCGVGAAAGWVSAAVRDHLHVRLLDPDRSGGSRKAVRGVRQDASIQLPVRHPAFADAGRGG